MKCLLDQEDTKQSPNFFSSEASNMSFEDDVSDGSSVPLFVMKISTHISIEHPKEKIDDDNVMKSLLDQEDTKQSPDFFSS